MVVDARVLQTVIHLVERALHADITLDDLDRSWPDALHGSPFWDGVREDIEEALAHVPFSWTDGTPLLQAWRTDWDYLRLDLVARLLRSGLSENDMMAAKNNSTKAALRSVEDVERYVSEFRAQHPLRPA